MSTSPTTLHYVEAFDHIEVLLRWLPLLARLEQLEMIVHLKEEHQAKIPPLYKNDERLKFMGPGEGRSWKKYLQNTEFSPHSICLVATIGRRPAWFTSLIGRVNYYVVVHNLNYFFDRPGTRLRVSGALTAVRDGVDRTRRHALHRLSQGTRGFVYPCQPMQMTAVADRQYPDKHHICLPFASCAYPAVKSGMLDMSSIRIAVTGAVMSKTRNYQLIAELINQLNQQGVSVKLYLAGRVLSPKIIQDLQDAVDRTPENKLYQYPKGLCAERFSEIIKKVDILIAPLNEYVEVGRYREQVGTTKVSGSIYDAIHFDKPLIVPQWYALPSADLLHYTDIADLVHTLMSFVKAGNVPPPNRAGFSEQHLLEKWRELLANQNGVVA